MAKVNDVEELLARAYGPGQSGLSEDEEARLLALRLPASEGRGEGPRSELRHRVVPKILGGAAVAAVLVAGLAGYGIGASRIDDPQLDRPLPSVLVPLPDGTARDTRDAECAVEVGLDAVTLTAVTCTWADGGEVTLTTDGIR